MELDLLKVKKRAKSKAQLAAIAENKLKLADRIFIDHRPTSINERLHYGDYEGDFIVSGKNGS
jgi:IS30 family transposase